MIKVVREKSPVTLQGNISSTHINLETSTGITKIIKAMERNGSPSPEFMTDDDRSYFITRLPIHTKIRRAETPSNPQTSAQVTPEVTPEVKRMLSAMSGEMTRGEIQEKLGLKDEKHFRENYQRIAVKLGLIEMTIPDKPRSSKQRYRLTDKGRLWLKNDRGRG